MARYRYGIGTIVHTNSTFSDPDSTDAPLDPETNRTLLDPTTVSCAVRAPNGTIVTYVYGIAPQLTRLSQGRYRLAITFSAVGTYKWTWTGTTASRAVVFYGEADSY